MLSVVDRVNYKHKNKAHKFLGSFIELGNKVDVYSTSIGFLARYGDEDDNYSAVDTGLVQLPFMVTHACRTAWLIKENKIRVRHV